jgi:hypothetical protein
VLGNIIHISTVVFPFVVMVVIESKYQNRYSNKYKRADFDSVYEGIYEGLKTNVSGPLHYQSLTLLRKLVFAFIVFYLYEEVFTLFQVMANVLLSLSFALYIAHMQPFIEQSTNRIQLFNEVTYYVVSLLYLTFTDFNPNAEIKLYTGWLVVLVAILNLLYPNLTTML